MSNFKFLLSDSGTVAFAEVAMAAERGVFATPQPLDKQETQESFMKEYYG